MHLTTMRFGIGLVVLAALLPGASAYAQGVGQSVCRDVFDGYSNKWVCTWVNPPAPAPAAESEPEPEPEIKRGPGTAETVTYDPATEAKKLRRDPAAGSAIQSDLCPKPLRMTQRDGCQP